MANLYTHKNFSPARNIPSPRPRTNADVESQYLSELLSERQKLAPFMQVLPVCSRLLDQEIMRVSGRISNHGLNNYDRLHSPFSSLDVMAPNPLGQLPLSSWNWNDWSRLHSEWLNGGVEGMPVDWRPPGSPSSFPGKRVLRLGIPVDAYPNFNFVGRLLGPRGNSLKRVEASTGCRVFIRGRGSLKDTEKEENLRGKPGYEHLNEPLHILIEPDAAQVPAGIVDIRLKQAKEIIEELLKPVEESQDVYKKEQLRELAMLRNVGEESPQPNGSLSPFTSGGIKRPKTGW